MSMRYDIISDTHGYLSPDLLDQLQGADVIVHAGDICSRSDYETLRAIAPVRLCLGNNDWASDYGPEVKDRVTFFSSGLRWQVCHYRNRLKLRACDIAVFGHTHTPVLECEPLSGALLVNPGSPTYPRRSHPSMARIVCDEGKVVSSELIRLA